MIKYNICFLQTQYHEISIKSGYQPVGGQRGVGQQTSIREHTEFFYVQQLYRKKVKKNQLSFLYISYIQPIFIKF